MALFIALISDQDGTIHFGGLNVSDQPTKPLSGRTRAEKALAAAQIRLDDLIPKKDAKAGRRIVFGANLAKTSTERTINMKAKSSKQSKKDKPAVKIKDLKPTKDARGGALSKTAQQPTLSQQDLAQRNQAIDMQTSLIAKQANTADQVIRNI
jgi:hypothetical protein